MSIELKNILLVSC